MIHAHNYGYIHRGPRTDECERKFTNDRVSIQIQFSRWPESGQILWKSSSVMVSGGLKGPPGQGTQPRRNVLIFYNKKPTHIAEATCCVNNVLWRKHIAEAMCWFLSRNLVTLFPPSVDSCWIEYKCEYWMNSVKESLFFFWFYSFCPLASKLICCCHDEFFRMNRDMCRYSAYTMLFRPCPRKINRIMYTVLYILLFDRPLIKLGSLLYIIGILCTGCFDFLRNCLCRTNVCHSLMDHKITPIY